MKKLLSFLLIAVIALTCALSASADVIFEPDDNFYTRNSDKCELMERSFTAIETVYTVNEPNSDITYGKVNAGDELYISYTYKDSNDIVWGLISFSEVSGWLPMGYLEVIYDNTSFVEEFYDEFDTDNDDLKLPKTKKLVFWQYPGSESYMEMDPWDDSYLDISFSRSYTDPNGITWGYVGYYYGTDGWLRIDDPSSTDAPSVLERGNEALYPNSVLDDDSAVEKGGLSPIWTAVILVGAACVVTVVLILILTKKKKA